MSTSQGGHSGGDRIPLPDHFQGISGEFIEIVDAGIKKGHAPTRIQAEARIACGADEAKKGRVPTLAKITSRRSKKFKSPEFEFKTNLDMLNFCEGKMCSNEASFNAVEDFDAMLVLATFSLETKIKDDTPGARAGATVNVPSIGFIFSSKRILLQFKQAILDHKSNGEPLACDADGTYRLFSVNGR